MAGALSIKLPWDRFSRTPVMPWRSISAKVALWLQAGPNVP